MTLNEHTEQFDTTNYHLNPESRHGCYLIHGFTSSTYEVRDLAHYLADHGYRVVADNLPGHGTAAEDCNRVKYADWLSHVEQGVAEMLPDCDTLFVAGGSMGSILTLHLATLFPLTGIMLGAPLLEFNHPFKTRFINPIASHFLPLMSKRQFYMKSVRQTYKYYGYHQYPMKALNQLYKMAQHIRKHLKSVKVPALIQYAKNDVTVPVQNAQLVRDSISSDIIQMTPYEKTTHNIWDHPAEKKIVFAEILQFMADIRAGLK
ncbi:MAG: alpha/beta fold hydrolase [Candidatus Marinimicrobia bacterium]|nr:alpha/beta fold hydrolase [Candidatus Neomarinimicrobiota bacterium]